MEVSYKLLILLKAKYLYGFTLSLWMFSDK